MQVSENFFGIWNFVTEHGPDQWTFQPSAMADSLFLFVCSQELIRKWIIHLLCCSDRHGVAGQRISEPAVRLERRPLPPQGDLVDWCHLQRRSTCKSNRCVSYYLLVLHPDNNQIRKSHCGSKSTNVLLSISEQLTMVIAMQQPHESQSWRVNIWPHCQPDRSLQHVSFFKQIDVHVNSKKNEC